VLHRCRRIITVSDFERQNIISKLHIPEQQVAMIYNGYNTWFRPTEASDETYRKYIERPGYFFFLGNTDPKKNTERTLLAYAHYLKRSTVKRTLLMADLDRRYLDEIIERHHIEDIRSHLVMPGYIVNSDLPSIYNSAFAFLYTSLRESFGIPLLEAMACGTPVITSNTSSMPEIGGKDAILVNPEQPEEITDMMLRLEQDDDFRRQQSAYGIERAKLFSWRQTATQLLELYEQVNAELAK
jgi:glycosyltransferase involved in cell wall biosynthesis